ncbi:MAG TPA: hypothetical protein VL172_10480 [Kofleriaceae bacterium]|nr:hypothetical protein [Kofleriaceae bacterium]
MRIDLAIAALALLAAACDKGDIQVHGEDPDRPADYGQSEVLDAVQGMAGQRASADAYRRFYEKVEALRPGFSESVAEVAELHEVFLAAGPLDAAFSLPADQQLDRLATTVWPVALGAQPRPEEPAAAFIERVCGHELQLECKYVVPEYWPLVLGRLVWKKLEDRARDAYRGCASCKADPEYARTLELFHQRSLQMLDRVAMLRDDVHPKSWPHAEDQAQPWSDPPLLERAAKSGALTLEGQPVPAGQLRARLAKGRGAHTVLGVYLRPDAQVGALAGIADDAAAAGYQELALLARAPAYPWPRREYRLAVGKSARGRHALMVRDSDTVQMLVQALDSERLSHPEAPTLSGRGSARPR